MTKSRKHQVLLLLALLAGLGLRLFFILHFPAVDDDSPMYEELGRNMLDHHVYGVFLDGHLTALDVRTLCYPAFLGMLYVFFGRSRLAIMIAQAVVDLATCLLAAVLAGSLAPEPSRKRLTLIALWLAATCPFIANYTAVPLSEALARMDSLSDSRRLRLLTSHSREPFEIWVLLWGGAAAALYDADVLEGVLGHSIA